MWGLSTDLFTDIRFYLNVTAGLMAIWRTQNVGDYTIHAHNSLGGTLHREYE